MSQRQRQRTEISGPTGPGQSGISAAHRALGSAGGWLVSHSGYIWLRRHAQMATMKRSDATTLPSGIGGNNVAAVFSAY